MMDSKLAEQIAERLRAFIAEKSDDPLSLRSKAARFEALPLCVDWGKCWAIRANGEVIVFAHEEAEPAVEVESDERMRNVALYQGSITYPEIKDLVPSRPADAKDCPYCKGIRPSSPDEQSVICYCGWLGWVPATSS
jgi:hypothetical protein